MTHTIEDGLPQTKQKAVQRQLSIDAFNKSASSALSPQGSLIQAWNLVRAADNPLASFNRDSYRLRDQKSRPLAYDGQKHASCQSAQAIVASNSPLEHPSRQLPSRPPPVMLLRLAPNWWNVASFFILLVCLGVSISPVGRLAQDLARFLVTRSLLFVRLIQYGLTRRRVILREKARRKHAFGDTENQQQTPHFIKHNAWSETITRVGYAVIKKLSREDYTVGLICALPIELAAVQSILDANHDGLPAARFDDNSYVLGRIGSHNVVIRCLPTGIYGPISAATVATRMLLTFRSIRFGLMVGIGGGVPVLPGHDIRLGDVVVGKPSKRAGGVFQCDAEFERTSTLNKSPFVLLNALSMLRATHILNGNRIPDLLAEMLIKYPLMKNRMIPQEKDKVFRADYEHPGPKGCCSQCDEEFLVSRPERSEASPQIHYGPIASVTRVIKSGGLRDNLAARFGNLCFEMEAAGLMDNFPCLVILGISDYADSHKNDGWQGYAAATAAAYAKELLSVIPSEEVENERNIAST